MIKASELRIGNIIEVLVADKVTGLSNFKTGYKTVTADDLVKYEMFFGVPLTEEWLLKFGFAQSRIDEEDCLVKTINNGVTSYSLINFTANGKTAVSLYHSALLIGSNLHYVHQLQNLYFALTGEELTHV